MKLSIILPTFNEEKTAGALIDRLRSVRFPLECELIAVDDASRDDTCERIASRANAGESIPLRILRNPVNRGKGFSIRKGIAEASGDIIMVQDADMEYDPAEIPALVAPIIAGEARVVYGSRFLRHRRPPGMSLCAWLANRFLTRLSNVLYGLRLTDMETCYKAFRADAVKGFTLRSDRFAFEPEITAKFARARVAIKEIPISYNGRSAGQGKKIKALDFFDAALTLAANRFLPL